MKRATAGGQFKRFVERFVHTRIAAANTQSTQSDKCGDPVGGAEHVACQQRIGTSAGVIPASLINVQRCLPGLHVTAQTVEVVRAREGDAFGQVAFGIGELKHLG